MDTKRRISRREFLRVSALATAGAALAACSTAATTEAPAEPAATEAPAEPAATEAPAEPAATEAPAEPMSAYTEAPMLAAMVAAGSLPPVEERLPENPMIFPLLEGVGKHGGIARRGFKGVSDRWGPTKLGDRGLVWFNKDLVNIPRIAESWEVNADGSEWTFHYRKGTKWSDGVEFTSQDTLWWYENVVMNTELNPAVGTNYRTGNPPTAMVVEAPDDYTAKFKFADPNPLFLLKIGRDVLTQPAHAMKKWHMDFTDDPEALTKEFTDAGFDTWTSYYNDDRFWWYLNQDRPTLRPWNAKNSLAEELFQMERNPYFWGVDEAGNQLPYWDGFNHRLFETNDVFDLWITNGEIDFQARHVDAAKFTLYKESEANGDYKVMVGVSAGHMAVQLNLATKEERLNTFFNTRDVRIGLSYAIDRDYLNELIYNGMATPRQYSPLPMSPQFYPKLSDVYLEYNVDKANQMLDDAGYPKGDDGFRVYPDGETITFTIEGTDQDGTPNADAVGEIIKMWEEVGVKCAYKYFERSLYSEHFAANEIEGAFWGGDRTVLPLAPSAIIFRGTQPDRPWAAGYGNWYNNGEGSEGAVEPPADHFIRKIWDIWDNEISVEPNPDKQTELFFKILDIWAEELPMIGVLGELPSFCIMKNGVHNFIEGFPNDDTTGDENVYNTETYYWDDPDMHQG